MDVSEVDFLTRFIVESDAIERISNDYDLIQEQIRCESHLDHVGAILMLRRTADHGGLLTEEVIKQVQRLITIEQHLKGQPKLSGDQLGAWRIRDLAILDYSRVEGVRVPKKIGTHWRDLQIEMNNLINDIWHWQKNHGPVDRADAKVKFIARIHHRYERTHPFADGNGRSGRAIVYFLFRFAKLEPLVFTHQDKERNYYPCFESKDAELMEKYFLERTPATRG